MSPLAQYLFAAMVAWVHPSAHDYTKAPRSVTVARYQSVAEDLSAVALDEAEVPLFDGPAGRVQTALLVLAITRFESGGWRADVDREDKPTGDGGHAWCLAQVHGRYAEGLTDRRSCFRAALRALRDSWAMCAGTPSDRIAGYTVGHCQPGESEATRRVGLAMGFWRKSPWLPPVE